MQYIKINAENIEKAGLFIKNYWGTNVMIVRGETIDLTESDGILAMDGDEIMGFVTYTIKDSLCEITSLASTLEGKGIGTGLVNGVATEAKSKKCEKIILETTNDNINALHFYQKRGFDMVRLRHDSMEEVRKLKPGIPLLGKNDIPLKHNIEFERRLD